MKAPGWFRNVVLGLGSAIPFVLGTSVLAADSVTLSYGLLELSVSVSSLEDYAYENQIDDELAFYLDFLNDDERDDFREILTTPLDVSSVTLSQMLYAPLGELWLERLGDVIQTQARQNGARGLRGALILAAADEEGLTLLNVMRRFPTPTLRINSVKILDVVDTVVDLLEETEAAIATLQTQVQTELAAAEPIDFSQLPNLTQPGTLFWQTQELELYDSDRDRPLPVDLYLPKSSGPNPLVVISHGFGGSRTNFVDIAQHLASHGIAVAAIEHPGSNLQQLKNLVAGNASASMAANEFVDRPQDVSYLLDYLETHNQGQLASRLDLDKIGVMGHSFGGYTALALTGAQLNIEQLETRCANELTNSVNVSIPLQCLALQSQFEQPLQDERIKAAFVFNPFTSLVFGETGLSQVRTPVFMISGSADPIAPALTEQIQPFAWLTPAETYLGLIQGGSHNYTAFADLANELSGPDPTLARQYLKALGLAFMQTHVGQQSDYGQFLQAGYAQHLSQASLPLSVMQNLTPQGQAEP
ncbi:dienelactone hydrolase [Leptolyngbya sp. Heron Island J]|uniref:alpha/beta hydrolase n=1 Tax=Leptolyngbya sp. Heron Island J TaxID=1385935 RepID=UPI0003B9A3E5|nr:alpha/beta hydrolase [Leptolyngbya sp. Heron Island J]ESA34588.1 dienelactone hydrolase [Leptolyngbya sp. Heron Island J]